MKKIMYSSAIILIAIATIVTGCKKEKSAQSKPKVEKFAKAICTGKIANAKGAITTSAESLPYEVSLLSRTPDGNGNYVWTWSIKNPNPGNGTDGTVQNLSHWGITLGTCVQLSNILKAEYSKNETDWTTFNPEYKKDKSQDCYTGSVLKFDAGTDDSETSYYRLTVNVNLTTEKVLALYKSGKSTGCGTFEICGFGECLTSR